MMLAFAINIPYMYATNPFFRLARLQSYDRSDISVLITLYSSGMYILKKDTDHPRTMLSHIGEWSLDNGRLKLTVGGKPVEYDIVRESSGQDGGGIRFDWMAYSEPSSLDGVNLAQVSGRGL
ncbi:MAG: hypothetical protein ABFD64_05595 [Armatimonadota bacterium]